MIMIFSTPHRRVIFAALAACACISGPVFADGQPKDVVVFGDSLSDPGNAFALTHTLSNTPYLVIPAAPYAVGGLHFSNGKTWIEQRPADNVNSQSSGPAYQVHGVFTNYAVGGARARTVSGGVNLGAQVQSYLNDFGGNAKASSTFVIFIGGNDIRDALGDSQNASTIVGQAVMSVIDVIQVLYIAGARKFVVVDARTSAWSRRCVCWASRHRPEQRSCQQHITRGSGRRLRSSVICLRSASCPWTCSATFGTLLPIPPVTG
jgi:phospholipase/lecithinase/hemolysin